MKNTEQVLTAPIPLDVIFQQCKIKDGMSPVTNARAWHECLQNVYASQGYHETLNGLAAAIYKVWGAALTRNTFSDALHCFKNASGAKAFTDPSAMTYLLENYFTTNCLVLNGNNAYVACGNNESLRFEGTSSYSLLMWMKFNSPGSGTLMGRLVGPAFSGVPPTVGGYSLSVGTRDQSVGGFLQAYRFAPPYRCYVTSPIETGQRCFFANTFDGYASKIFRDGVLQNGAGYSAPMANCPADAQFLIGTIYRGSTSIIDYSIPANIARAAVFNRALTDNEVQSLNTKILTGKEPNLVAYWDFTTKSTVDLSGNGNNGTLMGDATFGTGY